MKQLLALFEGRIIGGAVRNKLLSKPINDYDIATPLLPEEVIHRAQKAGFSVKPIGIAFGTVLVITPEGEYEITTLREDIETDGRFAKVKFGHSWVKDAERRDFTINALSEDSDGNIYDYCNGLEDIKARKVRFIGKAETRIKEDYLRILRFFRFTAAYGESFDETGLTACEALQDGLFRLTQERIWMELHKILSLPNYMFALTAMHEKGILFTLLDMPVKLSSINSDEPLLRLAALCVRFESDVEELHERLKLSNAEVRRLHNIAVGWNEISPDMSELEAKKMLYLSGKRTFIDRILVKSTRDGHDYSALIELAKTWPIPTFPLTGEDLAKEGYAQGEALGQELKKRKEAWMENNFKLPLV